MGFLDKMRAYLNEEESVDEETSTEESWVSDSWSDLPEEEPEKKSGIFDKLKEKFAAIRKNKDIETEEELTADIAKVKAKKHIENERKAVQDFCEQLIDVSFHSEEIKREYQVVTSYLTDIQRIEELPIDMATRVNDVAQKIEMLDKNRQTYLQSENLLSMDQFNNLSSLEKEVVDTIKNLNDMEMRDTLLKNDMGHLEGEKEDLKYMRNEYSSSMEKIRSAIIGILVIAILIVGMIMIYAIMTKTDVTMYALIVGVVAMISFVSAYVRYMDLRDAIKDGDAKLKRAVSLLNKVKVKYINNTNTLDYIYEKYGVHSSKELEYQWEQYNTMVRDAKRYTHANSEFKNCCDELVNIFTRVGLKDPLVWPKQTNALIDRREMVEIKHNLNLRRQKLRERLATCDKIRENASIALRAAIESNPGMESYISDMLSPYDIKLH
ncbi:MAG: hypothetical protein E7258_00240 [Lachnospiraceae bacterium]|nr:hypothetical protein [Lachnospiraceae bacterium]